MNRFTVTRFVIAASCLLLVVTASSMALAEPKEASSEETPSETTKKANGPVHVRVEWKENPATEATLSWTTSKKGDEHFVKYRAEGDKEWSRLACYRNGKFSSKLPKGQTSYYHHARLTKLKPSTKYQIVCQSNKKATKEYYFLTAPDDDQPIALLFGGDSRSGLEERKKVNQMISRIVAEQTAAQRPTVLAFAHGGDYILRGNNLTQWLSWLEDYELTASSEGRLLPIVAARGNHDRGPMFNEIFDFPHDNGDYYATHLSPQVCLTTLNTEISAAGDQRAWLKDELATNRWKHQWYLCQYHRPAFPAVKSPSSALTHWVPLFEQYQVDMVCEADGHNIKRTLPIKNNKIDPTGVVYIGEGGLGVGQRTPKTDRWFLKETAKNCGAAHHVHLLTFTPTELNCRVLLLEGGVFDDFTLAPHSAPAKESAVKETPAAKPSEAQAAK